MSIKTKILLTGASGFLGKAISHNLILQQYQLLTIGRHPDNHIVCDLSEQIPVINKNNINVVIHAAGKAHSTSQSQEEIDSFNNTNVRGTQNLLDGLLNHLPKQFVFISSVSVYGLISGEGISETAHLLAKDPYGKSKIDAESIVKTWCEEHNVICTILRLPLVVGDNPPGNLGAMIRGISKGYYFNIAGGSAKKSMVLASDIAKFVLQAAEVGGTYNLTDRCHPSFNELSRIVSLQMGRKFIPNMNLFFAKVLAIIGDLLGEKFPFNSNKLYKSTSTLTFDDSKAIEAFGWDPTSVLEGFMISEKDL